MLTQSDVTGATQSIGKVQALHSLHERIFWKPAPIACARFFRS
jgi:hypothetical protein